MPTILVVYFVLARRLLIHLLPNNANTPLSRWLCIGSLSNIVRNNCFFFYLNRTMEIVYGKLVERRVFWIFDGSISTVESFDMSTIMGFVFFFGLLSEICLEKFKFDFSSLNELVRAHDLYENLSLILTN